MSNKLHRSPRRPKLPINQISPPINRLICLTIDSCWDRSALVPSVAKPIGVQPATERRLRSHTTAGTRATLWPARELPTSRVRGPPGGQVTSARGGGACPSYARLRPAAPRLEPVASGGGRGGPRGLPPGHQQGSGHQRPPVIPASWRATGAEPATQDNGTHPRGETRPDQTRSRYIL